MRRMASLGIAGTLWAVASGCPIVFSGYGPTEPPPHESSCVWLREINVKLPNAGDRRIGYLELWKDRPGFMRTGPYHTVPEEYEYYRVYDDKRELIGRIEEDGDTYYISGPQTEEFKGKNPLLNGIRVLFGLSAVTNLHIGPIDPYRGS